MFLAGVTDPDGVEYTVLPNVVDLYVQVPDGWEADDVHAVFISQAEDELVPVAYLDSFNGPEGLKEFEKITLSHFSPYAMYDKKGEAENKPDDNGGENGSTKPTKKPSKNPYTGDQMGVCLISILAIVVLFLLRKKEADGREVQRYWYC